MASSPHELETRINFEREVQLFRLQQAHGCDALILFAEFPLEHQ
jgi:hypothetical protein